MVRADVAILVFRMVHAHSLDSVNNIECQSNLQHLECPGNPTLSRSLWIIDIVS